MVKQFMSSDKLGYLLLKYMDEVIIALPGPSVQENYKPLSLVVSVFKPRTN